MVLTMTLVKHVVTISHASLGGTGTNTWHLRTVGDINEGGDMEGHSELIEAFYFDRRPAIANGAVIAFDGTLTGVGPDEGSFWTCDPWTVTATGSNEPLPPFCSVCVTWEGQTGDRSKRGRTFVGPIDRGQLDTNGTIKDVDLTAWRDAAAALVTASEGITDGAVGIWSRQEEVFRDFVASSISDQFASLRSRRD